MEHIGSQHPHCDVEAIASACLSLEAVGLLEDTEVYLSHILSFLLASLQKGNYGLLVTSFVLIRLCGTRFVGEAPS